MLKSLVRDEKGNIVILAAVGMPLLLACAGIAVDTIQWVLAKRQVQAAADGAAIAGVHALIQGVDAGTDVVSFLGRDSDLPSDTAIEINEAPDGFDDDPFAVAVRITVPARTSFASIFMSAPFTITANATASVVENGEYCVFAIGAGDAPGLVIEPGSNVEMDCGIATNSSSAEAITAATSSTVEADRIVSFGGTNNADALQGPNVKTYGLRQDDPYSDTDAPLIPNTGCPNATVNAGNGPPVVLEPGCFGNIVINGTAKLMAGEYILNRGNLIVGATGNLTCHGCTFYLTSQDAGVDPASIGKVRIDEHATVKLSAPKNGENAGILIYQDRRAANDIPGYENRIGGSSFSEYEGVIYFPSDTIRIDAGMAPDLQCARLIGKRLIFDGRVLIARDCGASGKLNFAGTEVRLVR